MLESGVTRKALRGRFGPRIVTTELSEREADSSPM